MRILTGVTILICAALTLWVNRLGVQGAQEVLSGVVPRCPVFSFTGWKCGFCGMTRAFLHLFAGEWREAMQLNLLSVPVFAGTWMGALTLFFRREAGSLVGPARVGSALGVLLVYALARNLIPGVP